MTVRSNINIASNAEDYRNFRTAVDEAPEGTFEASKAFYRALDDSVRVLLKSFDAGGLVYDKCDQIFEIEVMLFAMLRDNNPLYRNEIESAIGLGETLSTGSPELCARVLAGLIRDRDFIASMKGRANDFVPGVDDRYEEETPV